MPGGNDGTMEIVETPIHYSTPVHTGAAFLSAILIRSCGWNFNEEICHSFFIVLGALDFLYGVIFGDRISMIAGGAIVVITLYVLKTKNPLWAIVGHENHEITRK